MSWGWRDKNVEVQRQPKELIGTDPSVSDFVSAPRMSVCVSHTEKKGIAEIIIAEYEKNNDKIKDAINNALSALNKKRNNRNGQNSEKTQI